MIDNPIQFLEEIAEDNFLLSYWDKFIEEYEQKYKSDYCSIDIDDENKEIIVHGVQIVGFETPKEVISFKDKYLPEKIESELTKSRNQINLIFVNYKQEEAIFKFKILITQIEIFKSKWLSRNTPDKYSFVGDVFDNLIDCISSYLLNTNQKVFVKPNT